MEGRNLRPVERAEVSREAEKMAVWREVSQGGTFHPAPGGVGQGRVQERSLNGCRIPDLSGHEDIRGTRSHKQEQRVDCPVSHAWYLTWREWVLVNRYNFYI